MRKTILLNLTQLEDRQQLHQDLKQQLLFPDYYGENLDALFDLLTEKEQELTIQVQGITDFNERADGYGDKLVRVLQAAAGEIDGIEVEILQDQAQEEPASVEEATPQDQALAFKRPVLFGGELMQGADQGLLYEEGGHPYLRFRMKNACNVELQIGQERHLFLEVERNIWELPLDKEPGFYYVTLKVDGVEVLTPYLPIGYGYCRPCNFLEIGPTEDFLQIKDVPHGCIRHEYFYSFVTGTTETCLIYTPPGYEKSGQDYPVLYLQHGFGENETCWVWQGKIGHIMDNLLAEKKVLPMLIVMADSMIRTQGKVLPDVEKFPQFLIKDLMPFVEEKYRVKADAKHRAIAGLSMGSMETSMTAFAHPELFGWIGLFSGFMRNYIGKEVPDETHLEKLFADPAYFNQNHCLFFRAMGKQDEFFNRFMEEDQLCEDYQIHQVRRVYEGGHTWNVWRQCILEFLQYLFQ